MSFPWRELSLSLEISFCSTFFAAVIGLPLAAALARRRFPGKSVLEAALFVPLVLPPTVVGFLLLQLFGVNGVIGGWIISHFHYTLVFSLPLAVIANLIVSFPLVYLPAKAGFAGISQQYIDVGRMLGASRWRMFWQVLLPLARRPIASGLLLAFARSLGEFGATNMVFGWRIGRSTLPIAVYNDYEQGDIAHALPAVITLFVLSIVIAVIFNFTSLKNSEPQN